MSISMGLFTTNIFYLILNVSCEADHWGLHIFLEYENDLRQYYHMRHYIIYCNHFVVLKHWCTIIHSNIKDSNGNELLFQTECYLNCTVVWIIRINNLVTKYLHTTIKLKEHQGFQNKQSQLTKNGSYFIEKCRC